MASQRETVLKALKTVLEGVINANGFDTDVQVVKRKITTPDEETQRPFIGITNVNTETEHVAFSHDRKVFDIMIYGYIDLEPLASTDPYDKLDDFVQEVEERLMDSTAWDYKEETSLNGNTTIFEGGANDRLGYFDISISIEVFYTRGNP